MAVPLSVRVRVARLVAGAGVAAGFPKLDREFADKVLVLAGGLSLTFAHNPSVAPVRGGGLEVEVRLDDAHQLFVQIMPDGQALADIDGHQIAEGSIESVGTAILKTL